MMTASPFRAVLGWLDPGEPHPTRGPFTRWPHLADGVLAAAVFVGSWVAVTASALGDDEGFTADSMTSQPIGALAMLAVAAAVLLLRRRRPVAATVGIMVITIAWALAGYGDGNDLALVVAVYSVGRYNAQHDGLAIVLAAAAVGVLETIVDTNQRIDVAPAVLLPWIAWYLGRLVRNRGDYLTLLQERADRLEADQHAASHQAVVAERSRIARELHDVVAHQVSMMTVQAGAAKTVAHVDLDAAVEAMGDIERAGRQALGELRHLLGVLHPDVAANDLGPQPGLADIRALVAELRSTGAEVAVTTGPIPAALSAAVELSAYRIVQESFTNIIKHAGPNPTATLTIRVEGDDLVVDVTNTVAGAATPGLPPSGFGISGMRERATLLGGTLIAGPRPPNTFGVGARIPIEQDRP
jgi:MYXO-CTERM domain-containing protein